MKKVYLLEMSVDGIDNELAINRFIYDLGRHTQVTWLTNLIGPINPDKFMLVADIDVNSSDVALTPEIGVKIVMGSQDMKETEDILNDALMEMELDEEHPKTFLSISNPMEFMYIILYEYRATSEHTRVAILPKPVDCYSGSRYLSGQLEEIDEQTSGLLAPYDIVHMKEHMILLYSD